MQVVPFEIAPYLLALPLDRVIRVEPMVELVRLPRPVAHVAGALVRSGHPLPVYDLRSKFGLEARAPRASDCLLLGRTRWGEVAVAADSARPVEEAAARPAVGEAAGQARIPGAAVAGGRMLLIYDLDQFLDRAEAGDLAAALRELEQ